MNYYGSMYANYNPEEKTNSEAYFNQVELLPSAATLDLYAGKSWKVKGVFIQLKLNVNNVLNNQFITDSQQRSITLNDPEPSPFVQYYFGRTFFAGLTLSF